VIRKKIGAILQAHPYWLSAGRGVGQEEDRGGKKRPGISTGQASVVSHKSIIFRLLAWESR